MFVFHATLELIYNLLSDVGWQEIAIQLLNSLSFLMMAYNFSYETLFGSPISILSTGPWWFIFLIAQLYLFAPILFVILKRLGIRWWLGIIVAYLLIYACLPLTESHDIPLFANAIGHFPEFVLGMGLALYPNRLGWRHGLLCVIIFGLSIMNKWTFPLSFLSAGVVSLLAGRYVCAFLSKYHRGDRVLLFLGGISMFMFVLNAQIRNITLQIYEGAHPNVMLLGACVHLMIVILVAAMYGRIHMKKFQKWLDVLVERVRGFPKVE